MCPAEESASVNECVHILFTLLGWKFAESGPKAPPFASSFGALRVKCPLVNWLCLFNNTESRMAELSKLLDDILAEGHLSRINALKVRGRFQFAS